MNNESRPAPKPDTCAHVGAFIAAYYANAGRVVTTIHAPGEPPFIAVHAESDDTTSPPEISFITRRDGSGFDIYAVDPTDGNETWHARVRSDFDYADVVRACENGIAFD